VWRTRVLEEGSKLAKLKGPCFSAFVFAVLNAFSVAIILAFVCRLRYTYRSDDLHMAFVWWFSMTPPWGFET
jgi:hypothetical protein